MEMHLKPYMPWQRAIRHSYTILRNADKHNCVSSAIVTLLSYRFEYEAYVYAMSHRHSRRLGQFDNFVGIAVNTVSSIKFNTTDGWAIVSDVSDVEELKLEDARSD